MDKVLLVKCEGKPTMVNLVFVTYATYDEDAQLLTFNFVGGGMLEIKGQEAVDAMGAMSSGFSDSITDEGGGAEEGDTAEGGLEGDGLEKAQIEADLEIERVTQQIKDLENQIHSGQVKGILR